MSRLDPNNGTLHIVRWVREDGRDVKHKYFRREHDAQRFLHKLENLGKEAAIYSTKTQWTADRSVVGSHVPASAGGRS